MSLTQTAYVKTSQKKYAPINLKPTNQIKCIECNDYFPYDKIQSHALTHIPARYMQEVLKQKMGKPNKNVQGQNQIMKKLNLDNLLTSEPDTMDISVQSFLPDEMPAADMVRKKHLNLQSTVQGLEIDPINSTNAKCFNNKSQIQPDFAQLTQNINHQNQQPEHFGHLLFKKVIKFPKNKVEIQRKQLHLYTHEKPNTKGFINHQIKSSKFQTNLPLQEQTDQKQNMYGYTVQKIKVKQKKVPQVITIQTTLNKKIPVYKQTISTASTGFGFTNKQRNSLKNNNLKELHLHKAEQISDMNNQCSECKGFYCKTCGSDIPPMYRPVPSSNTPLLNPHDTSFMNQEIKSFYSSQVMNNRSNCGKTSRVTRCSNCQ